MHSCIHAEFGVYVATYVVTNFAFGKTDPPILKIEQPVSATATRVCPIMACQGGLKLSESSLASLAAWNKNCSNHFITKNEMHAHKQKNWSGNIESILMLHIQKIPAWCEFWRLFAVSYCR